MSILADLDDDEFRDELREMLWDDESWPAFEGDDVAERAREVLSELRTSIQGQLIAYRGAGDRDWEKRAGRYVKQVELRLGQVRRAIKERNRDATASAVAFEQKWAKLAFALASELERSDRSFALDGITLDGELTVREWLPLRRAQQAKKALP